MVVAAFVCVRNAGRSQMAAAYAEREVERRGLEDGVDVVTGGTDPADEVHEVVVGVMREDGFDLSERTPREIAAEELVDADYVVTMGCSADDVCPAAFAGDSRDWGLDDPGEMDAAGASSVRDEVRRRVNELFDEIESEL